MSEATALARSEKDIERANRELVEKLILPAKDRLLRFAALTLPGYKVMQHHRKMAEALQSVESGEIKRLMLFLPPRHGKSELSTIRFPAWCLGRNPKRQIIVSAYNTQLATTFGGKVRDLVDDVHYKAIFPEGARLKGDSKSKDQWMTEQGGVFLSSGIGGGITGYGADLAIIDDPFKDPSEAHSKIIKDNVYDWYWSALYTRLMPGGAIILILCMTGDTPVLMATGEEKLLKDVRPGDQVATYEDGRITSSTVRKWANQGSDFVFTIKMKSGIMVKANARHPFLTEEGGKTKWLRTDKIRKGTVILRAIGENGEGSLALSKNVRRQPSVRACACPTTVNIGGHRGLDHLLMPLRCAVDTVCNIVIKLTWKNIIEYWKTKVESVLSANSLQLPRMCAPIGMANCASTIAMKAERSGDCFVTTATLPLAMERQRKFYGQPLTTFTITRDEVEEVYASGIEEVYDIQVDRTENFIANGLVSHNTRWAEDDLAGRLLKDEGDKWTVLRFPALCERPDDLGRQVGDALWPERYPVEYLEQYRKMKPWFFEALYQQNPLPDKGNIFLKEWWRYYDDPALEFEYKIQSWDTAFEEKEESDYSVCTTWGYKDHNIYLVDRYRKQMGFPELKRMAKVLALKHKPKVVLIEKRASGHSLIQEMRRESNLRVVGLGVDRSKTARAHACTDLIQAERVYLPSWEPWVDDYVGQMAMFPKGQNDDDVDSTTLALNYMAPYCDTWTYGEDPKLHEMDEAFPHSGSGMSHSGGAWMAL